MASNPKPPAEKSISVPGKGAGVACNATATLVAGMLLMVSLPVMNWSGVERLFKAPNVLYASVVLMVTAENAKSWVALSLPSLAKA